MSKKAYLKYNCTPSEFKFHFFQTKTSLFAKLTYCKIRGSSFNERNTVL